MFKKLIFFITTAMLLTACGASAPAMDADAKDRYELIQAPGGDALNSAPMESSTGSGLPAEVPETTEAPACDAEYFLFSTTTNTLTDDSGQPLVYESKCIPIFSSMDAKRSEWVGEILEGIGRDYSANSRNLYDYAAESVELYGTETFYSYSNYQQLGIARHDDTVVSLICLSSLNSGGAHHNSVQTAYNLDIRGQRILKLEDVIQEENAAALAALVRADVDEKFAPIDGGTGLFDDYAATIDSSMVYGNMTPYWYFNDTGLVIFYNQYELAPYAAGIIKVELPYDALEDILLEEYHPVPTNGVPGDLLLRGNWEGWHNIPITIESEGEQLLIGVEGRVFQVQLSELFWLDDTPIGQELIFSAKTLCQNDVLEITGGFDDETRSFAIEFINGRGEQQIYYLHAGELTGEP